MTKLTLGKHEPTDESKFVMMEVDEANECGFKEISSGAGREPAGVVLNGALVKTCNGEEMAPNMLRSLLGYTVAEAYVDKVGSLGSGGEADDELEVGSAPHRAPRRRCRPARHRACHPLPVSVLTWRTAACQFRC